MSQSYFVYREAEAFDESRAICYNLDKPVYFLPP